MRQDALGDSLWTNLRLLDLSGESDNGPAPRLRQKSMPQSFCWDHETYR